MGQSAAEKREDGFNTGKRENITNTTLPQVILADISLAYMQASPDLAHGARVQITGRLEENRRKN